MQITYQFHHADGTMREFEVDVERARTPRQGQAPWTRLGVQQCANCPLQSSEVSHCPPAVDLEQVVDAFNAVMSHENLRVVVNTPERQMSKDCDAQTGLSALLGLIMATSACPVLSRMQGMARTHLPFQSLEETRFRFVGAYFLGQLLIDQQGGTPDWSFDGLHALFDELMTLNRAFKARLQSAAEQDAAMNAVSGLAMHTLGVQLSMEGSLDDLARFAIPSSSSA